MSESDAEKYQSYTGKVVPSNKVGQAAPILPQNKIADERKPAGFLANFWVGGGGGKDDINGGSGGNGGSGDDDEEFDPDDYRHDPPDLSDSLVLAYIGMSQRMGLKPGTMKRKPRKILHKSSPASTQKPFSISVSTSDKQSVKFGCKQDFTIKQMC